MKKQLVRVTIFLVNVFLISLIIMIHSCSSTKNVQHPQTETNTKSITTLPIVDDAVSTKKITSVEDRTDLYQDGANKENNYKKEASSTIVEKNILVVEKTVEQKKHNVSNPSSPKPKIITKNNYTNINTGNFAVYCPRKMYKNVSYIITAIASNVTWDENLIKDEIIKLTNNASNIQLKTVTDKEVDIKNWNLYDSVEIWIDEKCKADFEIKGNQIGVKRKISSDMEGWTWSVTPLKTGRKQNIHFFIKTYDAKGKSTVQDYNYYVTNITVDPRGIWDHTTELIADQPKWAIETIIIPIITFFCGKYVKKKKKMK